MNHVRPTLKTLIKEQARAKLALRITEARVTLHKFKAFRIRDAALALYWTDSRTLRDSSGKTFNLVHRFDTRALSHFLKQCGYRFDQKTKTWGLP